MASFPTSIVNPTDPLSTSKLNNPSHSAQHQSHNAEIVALEAKVGVNSSAVITSHDYKLSAVTGTTKAVAGPASSTNKALAAFNGTSGNVIQNTPATIDTSDGSITMSSGTASLTVGDLITAARVHTDIITEKTGSAGVTVESVLLKAGVITGTLATGTVTASSLATELQKGWENYYGGTQFPAPSTITALGNRSYSVVYNSVDLTGVVSNGMRQKFTRSVTAPTQCTSLNGTTQYYSKSSPTGMAQTDSITESIWIKPDQYKTVGMISRNNGTTDGWKFYLNSSGQVVLQGARAADDVVTSYQSVPLNKWSHISASINTTTTTGIIEIDGATVPSAYTNNANTGFAAPTTAYLIGATNSASPTDFFSGKIAQAASWNAVVSVATQLTYLSQTLSGSETAQISAYSFNNTINDLNANANNLTANGSAVATSLDTPFTQTATGVSTGTTNFGIITNVAFSTNTTVTVQVPEGDTLPTSGGISAVSYSGQTTPFGFPRQEGKWTVEALIRVDSTSFGTPSAGQIVGTSRTITVPIGEWMWDSKIGAQVTGASGTHQPVVILSTNTSTITDPGFVAMAAKVNAVTDAAGQGIIREPLSLATQTVFNVLLEDLSLNTTAIYLLGSTVNTILRARLAYL